MKAQRLEASVHGRVQGVGFRWFVVGHARRLGVVGWVANERDGSVRLVAEAAPEALDELEQALAGGPAGARVEGVDARRGPAAGSFSRFDIRSSGHTGD